MKDISIVILTKDEELYIAACIESLKWADEIVVFDSYSSDCTVEIAQSLGVTVIQHPFRNFADQRNAALKVIDSEWVFFVDADERVTPELAIEVQEAIKDPTYHGWWIPTHNYVLGRLILHAGLYPDYHLRLMKRDTARYDTTQKVHEKVILKGKDGYLHNHLIHISCNTWNEFKEHQFIYAKYKAENYWERGFKSSYHVFVGPIVEFIRRFFYFRGYKDGFYGFYLSLLFAYSNHLMYRYLYNLWHK